jgi:multiple sugar transport system ATP-binding protein
MAGVTFTGVGKVYPDGTRAVEALDLTIEDGEFMVLVGPSGCGKTSALRMVAGLEGITEGELRIGEQVVNFVEPRKRDVAMVFQNYALYPHMTVFENIAFPLRSRKLPNSEVDARVGRTAAMLGLEDQLRRRPGNLSGGQRQRVAMGRAIVREPKVFLMDEPLSNLDAKLRVQMRAEIAKLQRELGVTTIYVTHDQVEAMTMGTHIAVMRKGVLQQVGPAQEIYDHPANLFVATFVGSPAMNLLRAAVEPHADGFTCVIGEQRIAVSAKALANTPGLADYRGRELAVGIRPEDFRSVNGSSNGVPHLRGEVTLVEALGSERLVHFEIPGTPVLTSEVIEVFSDIDAATVQDLEREAQRQAVPLVARMDRSGEMKAGAAAEIGVDTNNIRFFDLTSGAAIR